ncbi:MAG: fumarate hydratase [Pyramidobacter sp.]
MVTEQQLKEIIKKLWIKSVTEIPSDVVAALKRAREKETNMRAMNYLDLFIKNAELAAQKQIAVCTDTGIPTFFIKTPFGFPFTGDLRKVFNEAFHELTFGDFPMRSMVIDPLTGKDNGDNTAKNVPLIHAEIDNGIDYLEMCAMPKAAAPGTWSALKVFPPSVGVDGVKKFVLETALGKGISFSNPCFPIIVGVGIGAPLEEISLLATLASIRPIGIHNPEPVFAKLEDDLYEALNMSQTGPMGSGGDTTVLAVNIEYSGILRPWMPVAVNLNCWTGRRAVCHISFDGRVEYL